jgi:hypothetical protein
MGWEESLKPVWYWFLLCAFGLAGAVFCVRVERLPGWAGAPNLSQSRTPQAEGSKQNPNTKTPQQKRNPPISINRLQPFHASARENTGQLTLRVLINPF